MYFLLSVKIHALFLILALAKLFSCLVNRSNVFFMRRLLLTHFLILGGIIMCKQEYNMKKQIMKNRIIGYSLAVLLYILAEILIFFVNKGNYYYLDLFALTVMCLPLMILKYISFFLIYFTYSKNKYYTDICDDHIEGIGRLNNKTTYFYIKFLAMEEIYGETEKNNVIVIYTYDDNKYELPLNSRYYHIVFQQVLKKFKSISCRDIYKFYTERY